MALNGSGVAVIDSTGQPVVDGTLITSSDFNALTADLATMISTCVMKDGQQTITANIPMNAHKITGLAAATARTDAASIATIQDGTGIHIPAGSVGGTADVITLTASPAITAYAEGQYFSFIATGTNTTAVTVNINSVGAKSIKKNSVAALVAGDITSGHLVTIRYDGTQFRLMAALISDIVTLTGTQTLTNKTLTAPSINGVLGGLSIVTKRKTADESVTSSTTLQDDDHLLFAIAASEEWIARGSLAVSNALGTTGFKFGVTCPAGATIMSSAEAVSNAAAQSLSAHVTASGAVLDVTTGSLTGATTIMVNFTIWCLNGATPGNVTVQFAQSTSSGTAVTVRKGSNLVANRVA